MTCKIDSLLKYEQPTKYIVYTEDYSEDFAIPVLTAGKSFILGYTNENEGICYASSNPVIIFDDFTTDSKFVDFDFKVKSSAMKILRKRNPNDNLKYLYYTINRLKYKPFSHKRTWISEFSQLEIQYVLPQEQNRIVAELDKIQEAIDNKRQQLANLDELVNSKFYEMFGDPIANPKGWETKPYGDLFHLSAGGTPSKSVASYWENGDISWIGSNLCQDTILYNNDGKYISQIGFENSSAKLFPIGTVLIALVGATIGKTALLQFETTTNQNVLGIQNINQANYNSLFVFYYTQGLRKYFLEIGDGKFNMASKGFVSKLPMIVVDYNSQERFANFAQKIERAKNLVAKQIDHLQELLDSRMDYYFRQPT